MARDRASGPSLAAVATAAAGPIAFVALTAGPIARRLVGDGRPALIRPPLVGVVIVRALRLRRPAPASDDLQVPVGVVTGVIGGPYLIWLLATAQHLEKDLSRHDRPPTPLRDPRAARSPTTAPTSSTTST